MTKAEASAKLGYEFLFRVLVLAVAEYLCTVSEFVEYRSPELLATLEVVFGRHYDIPV